MKDEFTCKACGHNFNKLVASPSLTGASKDSDVRCPRCGSGELEQSPFLLGTASAEELTFEDYCDVALAPCCTPDWKGWRQHFYSTAFISGAQEKKKDDVLSAERTPSLRSAEGPPEGVDGPSGPIGRPLVGERPTKEES